MDGVVRALAKLQPTDAEGQTECKRTLSLKSEIAVNKRVANTFTLAHRISPDLILSGYFGCDDVFRAPVLVSFLLFDDNLQQLRSRTRNRTGTQRRKETERRKREISTHVNATKRVE